MNAEQKSNIDTAVWALGRNLASAWSYFYLLRGLEQGRRQNPQVVEQFSLLYDRAWRAIFDGFFAKVGTLLDNTKGTYSLPTLITLIRRYGSPKLKQLIPKVESCLIKKDSLLSKLKNWRHDAVAHHAADRDSGFYTENKMTLNEIEVALSQLEDLLNHLSWNVLAIHNDTHSEFERIVEDGRLLFSYAAVGIRNAAPAPTDPEA